MALSFASFTLLSVAGLFSLAATDPHAAHAPAPAAAAETARCGTGGAAGIAIDEEGRPKSRTAAARTGDCAGAEGQSGAERRMNAREATCRHRNISSATQTTCRRPD